MFAFAHGFHRRFSCTLGGIILTAIAFHAPPAVRADDQADKIQALWNRQNGDITSGKFEVVLYRYFDHGARLLDHAEAVRRLEGLKPNAEEADVEPIFNDLEALGWPKKQSFLWGTRIDVTIDGPKLANVTHRTKGNDLRFFDGTSTTSYRAVNRQATIEAGRSGVHLLGMREIRCIPVDLIDWKKTLVIEPAEGRDAVLRSNGFTVRFDRDTGFVKTLTQAHDGAIANQTLQFGPTDVQGRILPRMTVELRMENDKVRMASIYLIKSCRPNVAINPNDFRLGVSAGTVIVDHRKQHAPPTAVRVPIDLEDATRYRDVIPR